MGRQNRGLASKPVTPPQAPLPAAAAAGASPQPLQRRRKSRATALALPQASAGAPGVAAAPSPAFQLLLDGDAPPAAAAATSSRPIKRRRPSQPSDSTAAAAVVEPAAAPAALEDVLPPATGVADAAAEGAAAAPSRPWRGRKKQPAAAEVEAAAAGAGGADDVNEAAAAAAPKKRSGRKREPDLPPLKGVPTPELVARLQSEGYRPPPRPVPNLGYACLNMAMRDLKPPVFTSRDCIKRTMDAKGLPHLGELCLANCRDLATIIQWNHEHGIHFFRMSSVLCPWMGTFDMADLPQYADIATALRLAGDLARLHDQRITFHPSHFVKLGTADEELAAKSIRELEGHSQIMDLMGYEPSPVNKINIHVGGVYGTLGSKEDTMRRWAVNYNRLSPSCRARMTVENDDIASAFSVQDLLFLHELCGVPIVFDFHHHKFCPGDLSEKEALMAAVKTWPPGVRPVVHWSESQAGRKPHAHSDYVAGPIFLHGLEDQVDVMIEAKCKERALLVYRGDMPMPELPPVGEEPQPDAEAEMALKFL